MSTSARTDLKAVAALFAACFALITVDVAAQHVFLECDDRAPAIARMCR